MVDKNKMGCVATLELGEMEFMAMAPGDCRYEPPSWSMTVLSRKNWSSKRSFFVPNYLLNRFCLLLLRWGRGGGLFTCRTGGLTVFGFALLKFYALDGDTEDVFVGVFQILAAILFTHMAISVMQQGSGVTRSMSYFTVRRLVTDSVHTVVLLVEYSSKRCNSAHRKNEYSMIN